MADKIEVVELVGKDPFYLFLGLAEKLIRGGHADASEVATALSVAVAFVIANCLDPEAWDEAAEKAADVTSDALRSAADRGPDHEARQPTHAMPESVN